MNNPEAVWVILQQIEDRFGKEDGADFYAYVEFSRNNTTPWDAVDLDGDFTVEQLRRIADAMDCAMSIGTK